MKQFFLLLFFTLGFYNIAFTQSENDILKNEWSANINFFVNDLILNNNNEESIIDYQPSIESLVTYRRYFNKNFAWQIGGSLYVKESDEIFLTGFGESQNQNKKGYFLRTGFQKYFHLSNQVKFYLGTDLLLSFQKYKSYIDLGEVPLPNGFGLNSTQIRREKEIGLVPHLGFRWQVNSRISFSTEANLIASYTFFDIDLDGAFSTQPLINNMETLDVDSEKMTFRFQEPIVLLFNLRF